VRLEKIAAACRKSRPEIEIADKRFAFSFQTPPMEPSYKTGPKQVKMSISPIAQGFLKIFRVQHVALDHRQASKTHLFDVVYPNISIPNLFKTGPPRF
jgi:hypothetical protein